MSQQVADITALSSAAARSEIVSVQSTQIVVGEDSNTRTQVNTIDHEIRPFTFRQFFKVVARVESILQRIGKVEINLSDEIALAYLVIHAIAEAGDDVQAIVALSIGRDVEYFDTITPDDGLKLCMAIFKVNKDFFVQKIQPMIPEIKAEAVTMIPNPKDGETS